MKNAVKTAALLGGMWALLLLVGAGVARATGSPVWIWVAGAVALVQTGISYWYSDKLALRAMNAREVTPAENPVLYAIVSELSSRAYKPMPRIYIADNPTPNAFATGRNPQHSAVCVTTGILAILTERELRGVLGHELMHVYNRDILTSSVAAGIAGIITSVAQGLMFMSMFGANRRDGEGGGGILGVLAMSLLAPLAASIIQMAVSRTREFDADHDGAELAADPLALASALKKLESGTAMAPLEPTPAQQSMSHMFIAAPFAGRLSGLFSTHPPMAERISRLEKLAGY